MSTTVNRDGSNTEIFVNTSARVVEERVDGVTVSSRPAEPDEVEAVMRMVVEEASASVTQSIPSARVLYPTADGYIVFAYRGDPQPRRLFVSRADRPAPMQVCAELVVPQAVPLTDTAQVVGWAIAQVDGLRTLPELVWSDLPDEIVADILVETTDPVAVVAAVQAALGGA